MVKTASPPASRSSRPTQLRCPIFGISPGEGRNLVLYSLGTQLDTRPQFKDAGMVLATSRRVYAPVDVTSRLSSTGPALPARLGFK